MNLLGSIWRGEVGLEKVFWEWAVFGGIMVNVASSIGFLVLVLNDYLIAAMLVGYGISLPYNVFATVGVWRSAERYDGEKRWADIAKTVTVVGMALLSIT